MPNDNAIDPRPWELGDSDSFVREVNPQPVPAAPSEAQDALFMQSEYDKMRERAERAEAELIAAKFSPLGDNHHNAAKCPYCQPELEKMLKAEAEVQRLKRINVELVHDHNALLVDGAKWQDRADKAEAELRDCKRDLQVIISEWKNWRDGLVASGIPFGDVMKEAAERWREAGK